MGTRGMVASSQPLASEVRNNRLQCCATAHGQPHAVQTGVSYQNLCTTCVYQFKNDKPGGNGLSACKPWTPTLDTHPKCSFLPALNLLQQHSLFAALPVQ